MFIKKNNERIKIILFIMIVCFIFVFIRIFYVQTISYSKLNLLSDDLWSRNLPITAERGKVLDRNGIVLADNITTTSLIVIPNQIDDPKKTASVLSKILNTSYNDIYKHITKNTSIERIHPEGRRLDYSIADEINSYNLSGVYLVKESERYYPYGNLLSHVLGYTGIDNQGLSGIELLYDEYLTGSDGSIKYYSDAKGNKLELNELYIDASSGLDLMLTVDYNIQVSIERELDNIVKMFDPDNALAIVMNPNTGEVLAMSSRPDYNPNSYQDYTLEAISRNLPIWMSYEPGSTFKIITTAAAVEEGIVNLEKDTFYDKGSVLISGAKLRCWKSGGHGFQTYLQVFENSCNPGFVSLGLKLGKEKLFNYINLFGFGSKTGIDLNGEGKGIIFDLDKVKELELATTAFGQGVSVTPIQLVAIFMAIFKFCLTFL